VFTIIDRYKQTVKCLSTFGFATKFQLNVSGHELLLDNLLEKVVDHLVAEALAQHEHATHIGVMLEGAKHSRVYTSFTRRFQGVKF
jgi:hypothetical protein